MTRRSANFHVLPAAAMTVVALLLASPCEAPAQAAGKVPRIGVLSVQSAEVDTYSQSLRDGLREFGYVDGGNIGIEWRWGHGNADRLPDLAHELVRNKVDVIVTRGNPEALAAHNATKTIPIVTVVATDPIRLGLVATLARPGGNVTGLMTQTTDLIGKRLQILREVVPHTSRLAILWDPSQPGFRELGTRYERAAEALGMKPQLIEVRGQADLESAFAAMARDGVDAVFAQGTTVMIRHQTRLAELSVATRLPVMCATRPFVEAGCLMSYFVSLNDLFRRAAYFVDRILKGTKPADLPVQQPTKFELVINIKTAKTLGLVVPPSLLLRADYLLE